MIKSGLETSAKRNLFLNGGKSASGGGLLFQWNNTLLPTPDSTSRCIGWQGTDFKMWDGTNWTTVGGGSGGSTSLDDAYNNGPNITVDGGAVDLSHSHATNNAFEITHTGSGTGNMIDIQNGSTGSAGYDIIGTGDTWYVDSAGAMLMVGITGCNALTAATNLTLEATSGGSITIGGTSTGDITMGGGGGEVIVTTDFTITGSADTTVLTVDAGDVVVAAGLLSLDDDDTATGNLVIPSSTATSGHPISVTADDLTSGSAIYVDSDNGASFSGDGGYLNLMNGTGSVFKVQRYGATTIAGNAGSTVLTVTAGDVVLSDASVAITDADNAASLTVTNNTATTNDVIVFTGSGAFTGDSFMSVVPSGLTSGQAVAITCAAMTTGEALYVTTSAISSGNAVVITSVGEAMTSGELLTVLNNESGNIATITGNVASFTSAIEETAGTLTAEYDNVLFSRTDKQSHASQYDAKGSNVKILKTHNKAAGTIVDAVVNLEIESVSTGSALILGDSVKVTSVGVNERSLNIINAATGKDGVLVTSSGALTNGLGAVHITTTGDLATGGANLILQATGTTPHAASRLLELVAAKDMVGIYADVDGETGDVYYFESGGDTATTKAMMNLNLSGDPADDTVAVLKVQNTGTTTHESKGIYVAGGDITGIFIDTDNTYSAANDSAAITMYSNAAGDLPVFMSFYHEDAGAVDGEYCSKIFFYGSDDAPAKELYASIEVEMDDTGAANPDGILWIKGDLAGTNTVSAGFTGNTVMLGAAAATLTTAGAFDLTISTALTAAGQPRIVLTDGTAGNITITAGNVSGVIDCADPVCHSSTQAISGSGTINATTSMTELNSTGGGAYTMDDGSDEGQLKFVVFVTDAGDAVITPTTFAQTNVTFDTAGESALFQWTNAKWYLISTNGGTVT